MNAIIQKAHEIRVAAAKKFGGRPGNYSMKIACEMAKEGAEKKMSGEEIAELMNSKYSCRVLYDGSQEWDSTERFFIFKTKKSKSIIKAIKFKQIPAIGEIESIVVKLDNKGKKEAVKRVADLLISGEAQFEEWTTDSGKYCYRFSSHVAALAEHLDLKSVEFEFLARKRGQERRVNITLGSVFERDGKKGVYGCVVK